MKSLIAITLLLTVAADLHGQKPKIFVDRDGNKQVYDASSGWTFSEKSGESTHKSPTELDAFCSDLERPTIRLALKDTLEELRQFCERWKEVQPKNEIEQVSFLQLITRLLFVSPASSDFERYRGMELKTASDSTTYDAIILPNDIGYEPTCEIEEQNRHDDGMLYTYRCSIQTPSFPDAVSLKERLIESLNGLNLGEDQVREHGLSITARNADLCAPTGECLEAHTFVSARQDYKFLQAEANPILTRDAREQVMALKYGRNAPIDGISDKAANVMFEVISVGPMKTGRVAHP